MTESSFDTNTSKDRIYKKINKLKPNKKIKYIITYRVTQILTNSIKDGQYQSIKILPFDDLKYLKSFCKNLSDGNFFITIEITINNLPSYPLSSMEINKNKSKFKWICHQIPTRNAENILKFYNLEEKLKFETFSIYEYLNK
jgi:hypothetical protein